MAVATNIIRIKCPKCGAVLTIKNIEGIERKSIKCPICSTVSRFVDYKVVNSVAAKLDEDATSLTNQPTNPTQETKLGVIVHNGKEYALTPGANILGRKAASSVATMQIDTEDRTMSRCHITIEVVANKLTGESYYLYTANNMNGTYVNGNIINEGDKIVLMGGEIIEMGRTEVTFRLP